MKTQSRTLEQIAELTNGDVYEIVPAFPYSEEDLDYGNDQSCGPQEMADLDARPEIGGEEIVMEKIHYLISGSSDLTWTDFSNHEYICGELPFGRDRGYSLLYIRRKGYWQIAEDLAELSGNGNWMKGERLANSITAEELRSWIARQNKKRKKRKTNVRGIQDGKTIYCVSYDDFY